MLMPPRGGEETGDLDVFGLHEAHEVFHDDIDTVLMEVAVVAEGEEVEFRLLLSTMRSPGM